MLIRFTLTTYQRIHELTKLQPLKSFNPSNPLVGQLIERSIGSHGAIRRDDRGSSLTLVGMELYLYLLTGQLRDFHRLYNLGTVDIVAQQVVDGLNAFGTIHGHHVELVALWHPRFGRSLGSRMLLHGRRLFGPYGLLRVARHQMYAFVCRFLRMSRSLRVLLVIVEIDDIGTFDSDRGGRGVNRRSNRLNSWCHIGLVNHIVNCPVVHR